MTKETIETSKLKNFLYYLADKADEAYQQEVVRSIDSFLLELEQERQLQIDVDSLLASIQTYKESFYDDFTPALKVEAKTYPTGEYAELNVWNPTSPTDKHKVLMELEGPSQSDMKRLNRVKAVLSELF